MSIEQYIDARRVTGIEVSNVQGDIRIEIIDGGGDVGIEMTDEQARRLAQSILSRLRAIEEGEKT